MMDLADFPEFFAAINNGHRPFAWQARLCEQLVKEGRWPDEIAAPTGSGKSHVVDVHVFANSLAALRLGIRVPRRLFTVVNRRALVDDLYLRAIAIRDALTAPDPVDILREVRDALESLVVRPDVHDSAQSRIGHPLTVVTLRGGVEPGVEWLTDPRSCSVIAATPDMAGSRLLFRGYGATRAARPREAGLIAYDAALMVDEAHLSRQFLHTARTVAREASRHGLSDVPPLQVVATTATPAHTSDHTVGVVDDDVLGPRADELLARRLTTPKPVRLHHTDRWPKPKPTGGYITELADLAVKLYADSARDRTVGCIVNDVTTAKLLKVELDARVTKLGVDRTVVLWVGPMRPMDLDRYREQHPGLFSLAGEPDVAFLVATQTVEVGVDLDLAGLVTELASGSALSQRAGRVNRVGLRDSAEVVVVAPSMVAADRLPYAQEDLEKAAHWIARRANDSHGLAPWAIANDPAPTQGLRRLTLSTLTPSDVSLLSYTSGELFSRHLDLAFWLRDDLESEVDPVNLVVRQRLPMDDSVALSMLRETGVERTEFFPARLSDARVIVFDRILSTTGQTGRVFLARDDEWGMLQPDDHLWPGDTLVLDDGEHAITTSGVIDRNAVIAASHICRWGSVEGPFPDQGGWAVTLNNPTPRDWEILLAASDNSEAELAALIEADLDESIRLDVRIGPVVTTDLPEWVVVRRREEVLQHEEARQEGSVNEVLLDRHQTAVGDLAARMALDLGLPTELVTAMREAGLHHDDGKVQPEFQRKLLKPGASRSGPPLAKGVAATFHERRRAAVQADLPRGWRHEQYSVALASTEEFEAPKALVLRLVGTSHGRGRPLFPHGKSLVGSTDPAAAQVEQLFVGSGWSDIIESTELGYGAWGCSYLEAILRSADCLVSKDGS